MDKLKLGQTKWNFMFIHLHIRFGEVECVGAFGISGQLKQLPLTSLIKSLVKIFCEGVDRSRHESEMTFPGTTSPQQYKMLK